MHPYRKIELAALDPSRYFPPAESASSEGLLCVGGELTPVWLSDAYRHGIFPWPIFEDEDLIAWWSPDPRAIIELDGLHVARRLERTCRSGRFRVTCDQDFAGVVRGCAEAQQRGENTWITPAMFSAYVELHECGMAHSIEVWHDGKLAGGIYGVAIAGMFAGESMFYRVRDASKVGLVRLVDHLRKRGYVLFDIQQLTEHTESLGACEIPRDEYLERLEFALSQPVSFGTLGDDSR